MFDSVVRERGPGLSKETKLELVLSHNGPLWSRPGGRVFRQKVPPLEQEAGQESGVVRARVMLLGAVSPKTCRPGEELGFH